MADISAARAHLEGLLGSPDFRRSPTLSRLLTRLAEEWLSNSNEPVKEQILGVEVFGRRADWDPQTDSVVRVNVNRLRLKLAAYYAGCPASGARFVMRPGHYIAEFVTPEEENGKVPPGRAARAPSLGGLKLRRLTFERGDVTSASFCPEAETVVFSARWHDQPLAIYTLKIGMKYARPVGTPPGELCDVSATGQVLFRIGEGREGLLAQAEIGGGPHRELVDGVHDAVWMPDSRTIAATRCVDGQVRVELPLGNPVHVLSTNHATTRLSVHPSGDRIAFIDSSFGSLDYCIANRRGEVRRISQGWRVSGGIHWLTEDVLAVSGARRGACAIWALDLDGNEESIFPSATAWDIQDATASGRLLASCVDSRLCVGFRTQSVKEDHMASVANCRVVGLTPGASHVVLMDLLADQEEHNSPVLLAALPDGQPVQIGAGSYPQVSQDGKRVIFIERFGSEHLIVVTPIPLGLPRIQRFEGSERLHSAEFIGSTDRYLVHVRGKSGRLESHVFDPASGQVISVPGGIHVTLVSPDGSQGIVCGESRLKLVNIETGEVRDAGHIAPSWTALRWTPSGKEVFLFVQGATRASGEVMRVNVHTGEQNHCFTLGPADTVGVHLLGWLDVTPDGRCYAYTYQQDLSDLYMIDGLI